MVKIIILFISVFVSYEANAAYFATGEIYGYVYKNLLLRGVVTPGKRVVIGVKAKDGNVYEIAREYKDEDIEEYTVRKGRGSCRVRTKIPNDSENLIVNAVVAAVNSYKKITFVGLKEDGSHEELEVEYLIFDCIHK